jgi:hypothetical protein
VAPSSNALGGAGGQVEGIAPTCWAWAWSLSMLALLLSLVVTLQELLPLSSVVFGSELGILQSYYLPNSSLDSSIAGMQEWAIGTGFCLVIPYVL